jgi:hypothetical protein
MKRARITPVNGGITPVNGGITPVNGAVDFQCLPAS